MKGIFSSLCSLLQISCADLRYFDLHKIYRSASIDTGKKDRDKNLEKRLELVADVKNFSVQKLGLERSDNYLRYKEEGARTIYRLYVSPKTRLLGCLENLIDFDLARPDPTAGYYNNLTPPFVLSSTEDDLLEEEEFYRGQGYDVRRRKIQDFYDGGGCDLTPNFFRRSLPGQIRTIIHEDWHHTFRSWNKEKEVNRSINESSAQIISYLGAAEFLAYSYGKRSAPYRQAVKDLGCWLKTAKVVTEAHAKLDRIYRSNLKEKEKISRKKQLIFQLQSKGLQVNNATLWEDLAYAKHSHLIYEVYKKAKNTLTLVEIMSACPTDEEGAVNYLHSYLISSQTATE